MIILIVKVCMFKIILKFEEKHSQEKGTGTANKHSYISAKLRKNTV